MNNQLVIIGAGGHGKVIADIAKKNGFDDIIYLDDDPFVKNCGQYPVRGTISNINQYYGKKIIVAIGNNLKRREIQGKLAMEGFQIISLIHPDAIVGEDVVVGAGTVVMAGAVINPGSRIGEGCIVNTCASVDHDCVIGDYAHISVGAHLAGTVTIGEQVLIGAGAIVINNIHITADCIVGAGAVVLRDLMESATYIGIPAKKKLNKR